MQNTDDILGTAVIIGLAVLSVPYNIVRHPRKTYQLLVHKVSWY